MITPAAIYGSDRPSLTGLSSAGLFNSAVLPVINQLNSSFNPPEEEELPQPAAQTPLQNSFAPQSDDLLGPPPPIATSQSLPQGTVQDSLTPSSTVNPDPLNPTSSTPQVDPTQPLGARNMGDATAGDLVSFVKGFEGFNSNAYSDYGQTSIGYGTRARPGEKSITEQEAQARLNEELAMHRKRVEALNEKAGYNLTPNQLDALTSFDYNTGRLEQLTANGSRDLETIGQKIPLYNKADGQVLAGLTRRRREEAALFLNGYPTQ